MRIAGSFSSNSKHVDKIEKPFFNGLPVSAELPMTINRNPMDILNVQAAGAAVASALHARVPYAAFGPAIVAMLGEMWRGEKPAATLLDDALVDRPQACPQA